MLVLTISIYLDAEKHEILGVRETKYALVGRSTVHNMRIAMGGVTLPGHEVGGEKSKNPQQREAPGDQCPLVY